MSGCGCGCTAQHGSAQERRGGVSRRQKGTPPWTPLPSPGRWIEWVDLDLRPLSIWAGLWMSSQ